MKGKYWRLRIRLEVEGDHSFVVIPFLQQDVQSLEKARLGTGWAHRDTEIANFGVFWRDNVYAFNKILTFFLHHYINHTVREYNIAKGFLQASDIFFMDELEYPFHRYSRFCSQLVEISRWHDDDSPLSVTAPLT